jgi:hypothetical protein
MSRKNALIGQLDTMAVGWREELGDRSRANQKAAAIAGDEWKGDLEREKNCVNAASRLCGTLVSCMGYRGEIRSLGKAESRLELSSF